MEALEIKSNKVATAFRLRSDLIARLKELAKKDNRSLNNYVENVLMKIAFNEPNDATVSAIREAQNNNDLEKFDFDALNEQINRL